MLYVVVVEDIAWRHTYGPFASAARAAGWATNQFGFNTAYGSPSWTVAPLNSPRSTR
jgi:hypothetical protein